MTYGLGGAMRLIGRLDLIAELYGAVGMVNNASGSVSPLEGIGALRFRIQRELAVTAGGGGGILPGVGAPDFRVFVAMAWSPGFEPIGKGLLSRGPQLASATKKTNRPYDPRDDDKDGIINSSDDCPEEAEDEDNWADHDGCPELDNDKDGIADSQDRCPAQPEDHDNFKDEDGCVDPDDDGDGVADVNDRCPDTVEDMDGFRDKDGCDDPDNDKDGVPDVVDQCVLEPETINGNNDDDGCPDPGAPMVLIVSNRFELAQPVVFVGDGTKIDSKSHSILKQLSLMVRAKTEITKLRIAAHVHARKSRTKDMTLSKKRAEVVKKFLVDNGVEVNRIELQPFGSTRPIEKGDSKSAQAINDRIEFIIDETSVAPGSKIKITD
jgi:outer membrane protein OmpA-like peptidoglycan-associated protein